MRETDELSPLYFVSTFILIVEILKMLILVDFGFANRSVKMVCFSNGRGHTPRSCVQTNRHPSISRPQFSFRHTRHKCSRVYNFICIYSSYLMRLLAAWSRSAQNIWK